ncbi:MAG: hypothetical protein Q4G30_04000 [Actinomycetaceae bacterium]|nr:hypothetical protein [Actinomycetaceae bacterium]
MSTGDAKEQLMLATQLINAGSMGHGLPRTKATRDVRDAARRHDDIELELRAQMALVECYLAAYNPARALDTFSWCLATVVQRPQIVSERQMRLLGFYYPQVCQLATYHPDVPNSLLEHMFSGLHAFHKVSEPSLAATHFLKFRLREALGKSVKDHQELWDAVEAIDSADSDPLKRAIDIAQIEVALEDSVSDSKAMSMAHRLLTRDIPATQRARLLRSIMIPLAVQGDWQEAWEAHLVSYNIDRASKKVSELGEHFLYAASTGNWGRLLQLLVRHLASVRKAVDPWDLLEFLRMSVRALELAQMNGKGNVLIPVSIAPIYRWHEFEGLERPTISEAIEIFSRTLTALMDRFNDRNGSNTLGYEEPMPNFIEVPYSVNLQGSDEDAKVLDTLLRVRALLECGQEFDALIVLDSLRSSKFPAARTLSGQLDLLTSWGRLSMNRNAAHLVHKAPSKVQEGS